MPDITRLFKGPQNEFEVEVVFAEQGDQSPSEAHPFEEIIVTLAGVFQVDLKGQKTVTCENLFCFS
jgi:quercetin dioxygenase-like cupin family protein